VGLMISSAKAEMDTPSRVGWIDLLVTWMFLSPWSACQSADRANGCIQGPHEWRSRGVRPDDE